MFKIVLLNFMIFMLNLSLSDAILHTDNANETTQHNFFTARKMGQSIAQCFGNSEIMKCLENEIFETLDKAIQNNDTWQFSDFLVIEKNSQSLSKDFEKLRNLSMAKEQRQQRSLSDSLALKVLHLAQTRSLKLQLPPSLNSLLSRRRHGGISSAIDEFFTATTTDTGDVAAANPSTTTTMPQDEGRKKKDKDKNMAMMGGMAMLAMVAQMFLGKVILIAGAAFIMAKIALLVSVLGSLKKGASGSSGSVEHVIVAGGSGGGGGGGGGGGHSHEHSSGWHRSMPYHHHQNTYEIVAADEHKHTEEPGAYYEISENDEFKRRHQ